MVDSGILKIYDLRNIALQGRKPVEKLIEVGTAYYSERVVGYARFYAALGANQRIDALVRCHNTEMPKNGKYVILEDGEQYRIEAVQKIVEHDAVDLTLVRLEDFYDVYNGDSERIL